METQKNLSLLWVHSTAKIGKVPLKGATEPTVYVRSKVTDFTNHSCFNYFFVVLVPANRFLRDIIKISVHRLVHLALIILALV